MKTEKISILFTIFFISFNNIISNYYASIKLKVNRVGSVKIINNPLLKPRQIYINGIIKTSPYRDTVNIDNINDEIKLEWINKITDCNSMFANLDTITEIDFSDFDSSEVTDMNRMFYYCTSLKSINFCNFETNKVTNMSEMFANCTSLTSLDISGFNIDNLKYIAGMFYACYSLKELDLSNFKASSVITLERTFMDCFNLKFINLKGMNPCNSQNFYATFYNCYSLKSLDLSSFTSPIFIAKYMFYNCTSLTSLDISNIVTTNMLIMNHTFTNCKHLGYINFKNFRKPGGGSWSGEWELDNIFDNTPQNMVMCFTESRAEEFNEIFESKSCQLIDCSKYWQSKQKKINDETGNCMDSCSGSYSYYYQYKCYRDCPTGTEKNENSKTCEDNEKPSWLNTDQIESTCKIRENNNQEQEKETEKEKQEKEAEKEKEKVPTENEEEKEKTNINEHIENSCSITSFFNNECELNNYSPEQKQNLVSDIISKIEDGTLDSLMTSVVDNNDIIKIENENELYSISTTENQNFNETRTIIDLGDCEQELKNIYNLTSEEKLIIFKIEKNIPGYKIPIMGYELFSKNGKIHLDMDYCQNKNIKTNTYTLVNINENELYKYEPKNKYYNDKCNQYTSENGVDITLYDRKKEYNDNKMSLCEINCEYKGYDNNNKAVNCECGIKSIKDVFENKKQLLNEFINIKNIMNIDIIKCYKILLNLKGLKFNLGSYIISGLFLLSIICSIIFCVKGYNPFINYIVALMNKKRSHKKRTKNKKIKMNKEKKNNNNKKTKSKISLKRFGNNNSSGENIITINYTKNVYNKRENYKKKKKKQYLNDYELNSLSYDKALLYDKRTFFGYYKSLIKTKQIIIFSFFVKSDYNSRIIKIILFILSFAFFFSINALFFTDSTMHQIYIDNGVYDYLYQLPQIFYSAIISTVIDSVISYFSLTEESISEIRQKKLGIKETTKIKKLIKRIKIKFIIFLSLNFIFLGCIWYYLSIFCSIYKNTQIFLIKDTLISFGTSLVYPFFYNLIPGIFRIPALKAKKRDRNVLYKISQFLQVF